ncbi:MAG: bifunctional pyr operon transcriptional regulator/uracil phosphoribosyltransferase PyrR [Nitrospinae bacterium]|nr:bifunctional pyr operon transcriptional regulator/uracil phosphoribosyltransferase PyrR [Nitrospinota bacterium]
MTQISIMTAQELALSLKRIASEMMEACAAQRNIALIGVLTRGEPLARRLAGHIEEMEGISPPLGALDIGVHRDDGGHPTEGRGFEPTLIDFDMTGRQVFLVDDVFFTGRTVRAALDAMMELGRPRKIWLAALIDRGHRELPFRPDFIGKNVPTSLAEHIRVRVREVDGEDGVWLLKK